jgi:hypothetical protein
MNSIYYVWSPAQGPPVEPHDNVQAARDEARRLCQLNIGHEFFVLRVVESVQYRTDPFVCKNFCKG